MARRVSLQGKGVELFFGGDSRPAPAAEQPPADVPEARPSSSRSRTASAAASTRARTHSRADAPSAGENDAMLFALVEDRQRLASSTFRFQPEELEQLDLAVEKVGRGRARRLSKNDVVRLGLRWLLRDYEANRERSLLARLAARL